MYIISFRLYFVLWNRFVKKLLFVARTQRTTANAVGWQSQRKKQKECGMPSASVTPSNKSSTRHSLHNSLFSELALGNICAHCTHINRNCNCTDSCTAQHHHVHNNGGKWKYKYIYTVHNDEMFREFQVQRNTFSEKPPQKNKCRLNGRTHDQTEQNNILNAYICTICVCVMHINRQ